MAKHAAPASAKHGRISKSRYVPALDGLRSFAVLAVIFYHMHLGWAPGGLMGVTIFFVISGYLINGLLVAEQQQTGRIDILAFWMRRIRRLFPAIFLSVAGTVALCTLFDHTLLDKMRPDIIPSLLFYNNWWQIFRDLSYFEAAGDPSPLTHFWSLSIEEQFYVVWPLLLIVLFKLKVGKKTISRVALVLALVSAVEMALMFNPHGDPSRIYYGTDTRAMSLLLGVWLAVAWPSAAFGEEPSLSNRNQATWIGFNIAGIVALGALVAIIGFTNGYSAFPYYGGIALTSVLSAVVIAVLVVPETWLAKVFALPPFVWIGKLSYGMYLWHFPILLLTSNPNTTTATPWWMYVIQLALIIGVAWLSFTFIEDPIRKGKLREWIKARREHGSEYRLSPRKAIPAFCFAALILIAGIGIVVVPPTDYAANLENAARTSPREQGQNDEGSNKAESSNESIDVNDDVSIAGLSYKGLTYDEIFQSQHFNDKGQAVYEPLLIGDSVSLGAEDAFYEEYPFGCLDSVVSRNIWESPYPDYAAEGKTGKYVVFCLGTNNAVEDWQIDDLLYEVPGDTHVFMVNTRNTCDWLEQTNQSIANTPARHANVTVIDWYGASEGHDDWFAGDGTHLTSEGAHGYIGLIKEAIQKTIATE